MCRLGALCVPKLKEMMLKYPLNFFEYAHMHLTTSVPTGKVVLTSRLTYVLPNLLNEFLREGAGKSLARPTSRFHRTESIVSLERGVCSCAELQVFSCYEG